MIQFSEDTSEYKFFTALKNALKSIIELLKGNSQNQRIEGIKNYFYPFKIAVIQFFLIGCGNALIKVQQLQTIEDIIIRLFMESNTVKTTIMDVQNIILEIHSMLNLLLTFIHSAKQNMIDMCGNIKIKI